jgi:hypothetical protein
LSKIHLHKIFYTTYDRSTCRNAGAFIFAINDKQAGILIFISSCIGKVSSVDMSLYSHYHNCPFRQRRSPLWWLRHHLYPKGNMSLDSQSSATPYSTAITDSLDSQVSNVPLRIQFAGVTPVPLPPQRSWGHYGCLPMCHMTLRESVERSILPLHRG